MGRYSLAVIAVFLACASARAGAWADRLRGSAAYESLLRAAGRRDADAGTLDGAASSPAAPASAPAAAAPAAPPPPGPAFDAAVRQALEAALDPARIRGYVAEAAGFGGRGIGTPEGAAYARLLEERLRAEGLDVSTQEFELGRLRDFGSGGRRFEKIFSKARGRNVVARVEGGDPALASQVVLVTAHFDHLLPTRDIFHYLFAPFLIPMAPGFPFTYLSNPYAELALECTVPILMMRDLMADFANGRILPMPGRKKIFPGADDNGSGVAAALSIAQAFSDLGRRGQRARRTIVFAFLDGKEEGELGSKAYADALSPEERANVVQVINLDMIGWRDPKHPDRVEVVVPPAFPSWAQGMVAEVLPVEKGQALMDRHNPALRDRLERVNSTLGLGLELDYTNREFSTSDQYPLFKMERPGGPVSAVRLFDGGNGPDNRESDTPAKIDADYAGRVARLAAGLAWDVANSDEVPRYLP